MIVLKGFPNIISDYIELPDMGELLMYPFFYDTDIDDAYRYGTEFQRKLLDTIPLSNKKKNISVLSQVRFLAPSCRSCTGLSIDEVGEWHIDSEETEYDDNRRVYTRETDIVHLLTNKVGSMTEFNKNEIRIDLPVDTTYQDFMRVLYDDLRNGNKLGLIAEKMPHNRIVTFTNHMHRATNPTGFELKYMFRVVETDRDRKPSSYDPGMNTSTITDHTNEISLNISREENQIRIFIPQNSVSFLPESESSPKELEITHIDWERNLITSDVLRDFTPSNSIMLLGQGEFNDDKSNKGLLEFFNNIDPAVEIISDCGTHKILSILRKDFYTFDEKLGCIYGIHAILNRQDIESMLDDVPYKVVPSNNSMYKLLIFDGIRIFKKQVV